MKKGTGRAKPDAPWKRLVRALALALGVSFAAAALAASMVRGGILKPAGITAAAWTAAGLGAFAGAAYLSAKAEGKRLLAALALAGAYLLALLLGNLLFVPSPPRGAPGLMLVCTGAATAAGLLGNALRMRRSHARRR